MNQFFLFSSFVLSTLAFHGFGPCPSQLCQTDFALDTTRFQRVWYSIKRDWGEFTADQCEAFDYTLTSTSEVTVKRAVKWLIFDAPAESESLKVSELARRVVYSDYDTYAVTIECSNILGGLFHFKKPRVLSRTTSLGNAELQAAKNILLEKCSYAANFFLSEVPNQGCDSLGMQAYCLDRSAPLDSSVAVPSQMAAVEAELLEDDIVRVTWSSPYLPAGSSLLRYKLTVLGANGNFEEIPACSGCEDTIKNSKSCYVSMASLRAYPLSLKNGDFFVAVIQAENEGGFSPASPQNTGVVRVRDGQIIKPPTVTFFEDCPSVTIRWSLSSIALPVAGYSIEFKDSTGAYFEHPSCDGRVTAVANARKCSFSFTSAEEATYSFDKTKSAVRVLALLVSGVKVQFTPETPIQITSAARPLNQTSQLEVTSGDWTTMNFSCSDLGSDTEYEIVKASSPTWCGAEIVGATVPSRMFTITSAFDGFYLACRVTNSVSASVNNYLYMSKSGTGAPSVAYNAYILQASSTAVTFQWTQPPASEEHPFLNPQLVSLKLLKIQADGSEVEVEAASTRATSPFTFDLAKTPLTAGKHAVQIIYRNFLDSSLTSELKAVFALQ